MKTNTNTQTVAGAKGFAHAIVVPLVIFIALAVFEVSREWSIVGAMTYVLFAAFIFGIKRNRNYMDEEASVFFHMAMIYPALLGIFALIVVAGAVR